MHTMRLFTMSLPIVHFFVTGVINRLNDVEIMRFIDRTGFARRHCINKIIQSPTIHITRHLFGARTIRNDSQPFGFNKFIHF